MEYGPLASPASPRKRGAKEEDCITAEDEHAVFLEDYVSFLEEQLRCLDDAPSSLSLSGNHKPMSSVADEQSRELAAELQRALANCPSLVPRSLGSPKRERVHPLLGSSESAENRCQASSFSGSPRPTLKPQSLVELSTSLPRSHAKSIDSCGTLATVSTRVSCCEDDLDTPRSLGLSSISNLSEATREVSTPRSSAFLNGIAAGSAGSVDLPSRRLLAVVEMDEGPDVERDSLHAKQSIGTASECSTSSKASGKKRTGSHWLLAPRPASISGCEQRSPLNSLSALSVRS